MNDVMNELAKIECESIFTNGVLDTGKQPFVMAYNSFILNEKYTMQQKVLFLGLKSYGGMRNNCYPSKATLAKKLSTTVKTIERLLKQLEELGGILTVNRYMESNRKTSNLYILADIDITTGNFIQESLGIYKHLKKTGVKVKGK